MLKVASIILFLGLATGPAAAQDSVQSHIQLHVENMATGDAYQVQEQEILSHDVLQEFYANRGFQPAWNDNERIGELMELVLAAPEHGLRTEDYLASTLQRLLAAQAVDPAPERKAELDILLTESLVRYGINRRFGKVDPGSFDQNINFNQRFRSDDPLEITLQRVIEEGDIRGQLKEATQSGAWYASLKDKLAEMTAIADEGGWEAIPDGPTLHPGDTDSRIPLIRARLARESSSMNPAAEGDLFNDELESAVLRFQNLHGLEEDAVIGPATLRAMNVPVSHRIDQLRLSLERLRWVTSETEDNADFVAANIAGFRVYLVRDHEIAWTTRAMVGKTYRQTPIFRGAIQYLEFNPTWTVPSTILKNDVLPAIKRDVNYLAEKNMVVLNAEGREIDPTTVDWQSLGRTAPYTFRQTAGPWNVLGLVKFIFPNPHFVFLHDTSHRELFVNPKRDFSSGCIRVENPLDLAELLLQNQSSWDRGAIDRVIDSQETQRAILDDPMPVFIVYLTAVPGMDGEVMFLEDVYERDAKLLSALNAPVSLAAIAGQ